MCLCIRIFGSSRGLPISDRSKKLQLLYTMKKKSHFYSVGTFLQFLMLLLKSKTFYLCHTLGYSNWKAFQGWSKDFQESHYSHLIVVRRAGYQAWIKEGGSGRVWCDVIQRYRQRFSQFHSIGVVELFTASVRKFFWKRPAGVKETKLTQTSQLVKTLLESQSLDFLIPKSVTSKLIL